MAIRDKLKETEFSTALDLPPKERLYRFGWLSSVFGLSAEDMNHVVPDSKRVRVWLVSPGTLDFREGEPTRGQHIPRVPDLVSDLIPMLAAEALRFPLDSMVKFEWQGPASVARVSSPTIYYQEVFSIPLRRGLSCAADWTPLIEMCLQFLEPPESSTELMPQSVGILDTRALRTYTHDFNTEKARRERAREINESLAAAVNDPSLLEPNQIQDVEIALGNLHLSVSSNTLPIPFASPFSKFLTIVQHQRINKLPVAGLAVYRGLAAYTLANRENRIPRTGIAEMNELLIYFRIGDGFKRRVQDRFLEFCARLFAIVENYQLIAGFVAPFLPEKPDHLPELAGNLEPDLDWGSRLTGSFGKLITQWPLPGRQPKVGETHDSAE